MSGYHQRNRDRGQYRGQNSGGGGGGGGNYNRDSSYQRQTNIGRQQMVNPWQSGMMPAMGGGMQPTGGDEAALAFNILNQVLASDSSNMMSSGQNQGRGFQDRKSRNTAMNIGNRLQDRRRGQSPQFSNRNQSDRGPRQWSRRSRSPHGRDNRSNSSKRDSSERNKKPVMERLGKHSEKNKRNTDFKKNQNKEHKSSDKRKKTGDEESDSSTKERQNSEDRSSVKEEPESKTESGGKEETKPSKSGKSVDERKNRKDKEYEESVIKCLKCHICEIDSFDSIESFRNHKKDDDHKKLAGIYFNRSEAVLQLLRADSKLAANRDREKAGNANKESFSAGQCVKCDCMVADAFKSHKKSIEHELVDNYLTRECCGSNFTKRREFEDHRLTILHLKKHKESQKENEPDKVVLAFTDEEESAIATLRELKDVHRMELKSPADFPDFDTDKPLGLGYVHKKRRFNCTVCKKTFPSYNTMALAHCRSFNHYLMLLANLETKLKEVEDEDSTEMVEKKDSHEEDVGGGEEVMEEEKEEEEEEEEDEDEDEDEDKEEDEEEERESLVTEEEEEKKPKDETDVEMTNDHENTDGDEEMMAQAKRSCKVKNCKSIDFKDEGTHYVCIGHSDCYKDGLFYPWSCPSCIPIIQLMAREEEGSQRNLFSYLMKRKRAIVKYNIRRNISVKEKGSPKEVGFLRGRFAKDVMKFVGTYLSSLDVESIENSVSPAHMKIYRNLAKSSKLYSDS